MRRRECFALLGGAMIFAALMVVSPAAAQQSPAQTWCYGNDSTDDQTIAGCTRVIQSGRENQRDLASAYFNRGLAYGHKGDFDRAIRDFDEAIKINPNYVEALYCRGLTYSNKGLWDRAIQDYDEAIKLNPDYVKAISNRGNAYLAKRQYDRAIQDYDQARLHKPRSIRSGYSRLRPGAQARSERRRRHQKSRYGHHKEKQLIAAARSHGREPSTSASLLSKS
jgi:tetratricopeptide (TPR) repeat protein